MGVLDRLFGRDTALVPATETVSGASPCFAVVDVETTGLSLQSSRVLEMAVVLTDTRGIPVWEWSSRFNPEGPVGATHIHGITDADVADAPLMAEWLPYISQALAGRVVVAHNAGFDLTPLTSRRSRRC